MLKCISFISWSGWCIYEQIRLQESVWCDDVIHYMRLSFESRQPTKQINPSFRRRAILPRGQTVETPRQLGVTDTEQGANSDRRHSSTAQHTRDVEETCVPQAEHITHFHSHYKEDYGTVSAFGQRYKCFMFMSVRVTLKPKKYCPETFLSQVTGTHYAYVALRYWIFQCIWPHRILHDVN
jgi:hypothetical protein